MHFYQTNLQVIVFIVFYIDLFSGALFDATENIEV